MNFHHNFVIPILSCAYFLLDSKTYLFQVLETIGPPYSSEFVHLFMPMVENDEITGTMRGDGENDPVSEFIGGFGYSHFVTCLTGLHLF